jgi:photosystem II stability/assembly factor-like uncharacterized protein
MPSSSKKTRKTSFREGLESQKIGFGGLKFSFTISSVARFWVAVLIFLLASSLALIQFPRSDPMRPPRRFLSAAWWRYPLEWNASSRLAKIKCGLNAIYAVPNTTSVWAVGNIGMVVASTDGGGTWTKRGIESQQVTTATPNASPYPSPEPSTSRPQQQTTSSLSAAPSSARETFFALPDLIPTAEAAAISAPQKPTGQPAQSTLQTPTTTPQSSFQGPVQKPVATPTLVRRPTPNKAVRQPTPSPMGTPLASSPTSTPTASPISSGGGKSSWAFEFPSEVGPLIAIQFVDETRGEAVNNMGWRFTTTDGGASWNPDFIKVSFFKGGPQEWFPMRLLQLSPPGPNAWRWYFVVTGDGKVVYWDKNGGKFPNTPRSDTSIPTAAQYIPSDNSAWVAGAQGAVYRLRDISNTPELWKSLHTQSADDLHGVYFTTENRGWVCGTNGVIQTTNDGGATWQLQHSGTKSQLNSINFLPDGQHGWIAGNDGLILGTDDGGATWLHRTQGREGNGGRYLRFPAPWYFLSLLILGLLMRRRPGPAPEPPEESVADVLVSDRPLEEASGDVLAFNSIARGLSRFLRNENTLPPLTIAITGEWGTGKSSLMNLLRADLRSYKFRPVWFNAWHHQKEEHMLASLLENIKLQAVPRWWTTRGFVFRARLLKIRGWRQWLPVMLLLFFIYVMLIYHFQQHDADADFNTLLKNLVAPVTGSHTLAEAKSSYVTLLPLLAGIVTFLGAAWRGITAFGVKPASLLAGVSRGVSIRGLEAQTSFRQKFSVEFNDVTRALGKRSMLIFIDDLDRCRPENVLETLEAVNFLTTSGDCFVVIGMAREYVERCVGRAFKEVAEEMIDDVEDQSAPVNKGKDAAQLKEDIAKEKRIEFARQYLDKLINIEVPVPAPKQSQSLALLVASTRDLQHLAPKTSAQRLKVSLVNFVEQHWRFAPSLLAVGGLLVVGFYLARGLRGSTGNLITQETVSTVAPTAELTPTPTPAPNPSLSANRSATPTPTPTPTPAPTLGYENERPALAAGARAIFSPGVLPAAALLVLIWLGSTILTRRPGLVVKDSSRFVTALEIWHPVVFARQSTPRATKRFMNHVRYLAMRQRRQGETQPPLKHFLTRLKERFTEVPSPLQAAEVTSNGQIIPDDVLVALAALQHLNRECLNESPAPTGSLDRVWPRVVDRESPFWVLFDKARSEHDAKFHNWGELSRYRELFLEMTANVQVR